MSALVAHGAVTQAIAVDRQHASMPIAVERTRCVDPSAEQRSSNPCINIIKCSEICEFTY